MVSSRAAVVNTVTSTAPRTSTRAPERGVGRCRLVAMVIRAATPMGTLR
ncbi:MAG TPA: hypothetical protein VHV74_07080 [Pseudonocardiaceae bacterium]|nr:hypothetical protein [Pseudonocardiaceae bacterium]